MRKATKSAAQWFGIVGGSAGLEHGIFEIMQGRSRPDGLVISSIGPPCVPEDVWNACEPAMTILPNFLFTGILAVLIGLGILVWSIGFIEQNHSGKVLFSLSILLLLFGGGFFPPIICLVGSLAASRIFKPIPDGSGSTIMNFAARLWPWPMVLFLVWIFGQWIVGYFFNDVMQQAMYFGVLLILVCLPLSIICAYAKDIQSN